MPDLTTMHLKCLLDQATPGPWEYKLEDGYIMGDLVEILNGWIQTADGKTVLGTGLEINDEQELRNLALAATAPELAEELIRLRGRIEGLITAMEEKAGVGNGRDTLQELIVAENLMSAANQIRQILLGDHDD